LNTPIHIKKDYIVIRIIINLRNGNVMGFTNEHQFRIFVISILYYAMTIFILILIKRNINSALNLYHITPI